MAPLISLRGITRTYLTGESVVHALRGIDFDLERGELVAITGASGSGKSTALNVLGTLDRPDAGQYLFDGEPIERRSEVELARLRNRRIGFVFQSFHLLARDSALKNVELPLIYSGIGPKQRRERASRALARVGLADRAHHLPSQLSGGQQQRVAIARAIVGEPELLLADEPTGALDSKTSDEVMELLLELGGHGMTIALVTHDPAVAARARRVVSFRDGEIVSDTAGAA